jgi:dihydrofolate reductase
MSLMFVFINVSLDGYVEGAEHDISWAHGDSEPFAREQGRTVEAILFGRRTFELMRQFWPSDQARQIAQETARFMNEKPKYVASHQAFEPGWTGTTVLHRDALGQIRALKDRTAGRIAIFGSNTLCASLLDAGLLDEIQLMVNPVLLGEGTPLLSGIRQRASLRLVNAAPQANGAVLLTYARAADGPAITG